MDDVTLGKMAQLASAIDNLSNRLNQLERRLTKTNRPKDIEKFGQVELDDDDIAFSSFADFERPFDNVRVIFDAETENLKYIGLIDDLPF
jgi:hypothetical protein